MADHIQANVKAYIFKRRLLWVGWIVERNEPASYLYADNTPYMTMEPEVNMRYLTFGLTKESVENKLVKYCRDNYGIGGYWLSKGE